MTGTTTAPAKQGASTAAAPTPFRRTSQPTVLATGFTQTVTMDTATVDIDQWQLPPSNILREVILEVTATTSGNSATVAFAADAPLNVFSTVDFTDAGGTSIVGSFDSYTLAMIMKYGGYARFGDPRGSAVYAADAGSGATDGGFNIVFHIPVEVVHRTGFGSLENTSTNSPLQLNLTVNKSGNIYTTAPTNLPSVKVAARLGGYWQGPGGPSAPQAFGSTQYWNSTNVNGLSGDQTITLPNLGLGNPLRTDVYINRASNARSSADFPDPIEIDFRGNKLRQYSQNSWLDYMSRAYGLPSATADTYNGVDTGVFVLPFDQDFGLEPGAELGNGYLKTNIGDPVTFVGSWAGTSNLYLVRNFIAIKGAATPPAAAAGA